MPNLLLLSQLERIPPHKILTGRNDSFDTIRKHGGLCGFSHPGESPYDHFYAGHAGTAFSLALGLAKKRDLMQEDEFVLPILEIKCD